MSWFWPWSSSTNVSKRDLVIAALLSGRGTYSDSALGCVEAAASLWQDAVAGAEQLGGRAVSALDRSLLVRDYLIRGEALRIVEVVDGRPVLVRCSLVEVYGTLPYRDTWTYRLQVESPSRSQIRTVSAAQVLHWRRNPRSESSWRGRSVFADAPALASLASEVERSLYAEHRVPSRRVMSVAYPGRVPAQQVGAVADEVVDQVTKFGLGGTEEGDIVGAAVTRGAETPDRGAWRLGAEPQAESVELRAQLRHDVAASFGIPAQVLYPESGAAQALRETRSIWARTRVAPMLESMAAELRLALSDDSIAFESQLAMLESLDAKARATQRYAGSIAMLVKAGMSRAEAVALIDSQLALPVPHNFSLDFMKPLHYGGEHGDSESGRAQPAGQPHPTASGAGRVGIGEH